MTTKLEQTLEQAAEVLDEIVTEANDYEARTGKKVAGAWPQKAHTAAHSLREQLEALRKQEPLTPREVELIDGMIEVQLHHAAQCDAIANRTMADKQKKWDIERVELLRKLKAAHGITGSKV